jgi:hypothetical protein
VIIVANVYISTISGLNKYDDRYEIISEPKYIYHIEVKEIEKLLIDYLLGMNRFPIYLTITTYNDYEEFETLLKRTGQEYEVNSLADVVYASTEDGGMLKYNVPIFKVKITDAVALESIISNTFWMAESNCTFILSFSDNVSFKNEMGKDWKGKETEYSTILIDMTKETTTIGITHDAYGLLLFSDLEENRWIETIAQRLPNYTIVTGK